MKTTLAAIALIGTALWCVPASAQMSVLTVGTCGTQGYDSGYYRPLTQDLTGNLCDGQSTIQPGNTQNTTPWLTGGATTTLPINISTATTTELIPLVSGKVIVAYPVVISGGTDNLTFEYGSGTACATGTTVLTGAMGLFTGGGLASPIALYVPAGKALCALTSAPIQLSGYVSFNQYTP